MSEPRGSRYQNQQGLATVHHGSVSADLIAAASGKKIYVTRAFISVIAAAAGGGGQARLRDGTDTNFIVVDANSIGNHQYDFGDTGYELTAGNALKADVDGAVTTQATVVVTALGYYR